MKHIQSVLNMLALDNPSEAPHRVACILRYLGEASDPFNGDVTHTSSYASNVDFGRHILLSICADTLDAVYSGEAEKLETGLKNENDIIRTIVQGVAL